MMTKLLISLSMILAAGVVAHSDSYPVGDSLLAAFEYESAADYFDSAAAVDSNSSEANWKLAKCLNYFAELQPKDSQLALYEKAALAADRAIALDSLEAEGYFQLARASGKIALFKGVFKSVGLAKKVKSLSERTLELKSDHDGAYHILGRWHREVSQKPKFLRVPLGLGSANKDEGLKLLTRAIELNPGFIHHRLEYGISLLDLKHKDEARKQFDICLGLPAYSPLDSLYQKEAKDYLAQLDQNN